MTERDLLYEFLAKAGLDERSDFPQLVEALRLVPYGRPQERTAEGLLHEWRGTCSTKHELLVNLVRNRWPEMDPRIIHRVYRLTPTVARRLFGDAASTVVPEEGVVDVHTYVTVVADGRRLVVDATVSGEPWDGRSDMKLACGDGDDFDGGQDPVVRKAELVQQYCDVTTRERVIDALSARP